MAGVGKEVSKRRFYNHIAYSIKHLADRAKNIGFCFSYSIDTRPDLDGVVKGFSKEVQASSVVGTLLGQSTLDALKRYSKTPRKIAILNDTVACIMGGIASVNKEDYSTFVGYIYGTGTNISYIEKGENVIKVTPTDRKDNMVINTECGGFRGFSQGTFDKMADSMTSSQGMHLTEKMTSGRYISSVISCALYKAQEENLFTGDAVLSGKTVADTACISDFLANPDDTNNVLHKCFYGSEDRAFVRETALGIIDRAAKIGAIMVCGAMIKSGGGKEKPIGLVVEGTTFSKLYSYKERFIAYMDDFTSRYGIKYNIITGKNLNLTGTALAAALL
jgi:hexokinase